MKLVWRLNLITISIAGTSLWCASLASRDFSSLRELTELESQSLERRTAVIESSTQAFNPVTMKRLQKLRAGASSANTQTLLSDYIQSYAGDRSSSQSVKQLESRAHAFLDLESRFGHMLRQRRAVAADELERMAMIAFLLPLFGIFYLAAEFRLRWLKSINRLSRRMLDFLADRYSFQFSEPEQNEIGSLQKTFNSLAQRVINNMDELKSLDQAKSDFLSITSHELRTPMTSIKGSLNLLASGMMGPIDPTCMKLINVAELETDRLIRLINDLLDLAKIEAGKLPLSTEWRNWAEIVERTAESLTGFASKAGVRIASQAIDTRHDSFEVFADADRVQQVLTNLISNAIKFSPEGSTVTIAHSIAENGDFLVHVTDQGPGISAEDQSLIFEKFRQGTSVENPLVKGTGLGLAICKALVEEHGGHLGVESHLGLGSTFWFTLPKWRHAEVNLRIAS
jgi:signal transduction histidine kinase